ncbi:MAG: hypothetical protein IJG52_03340 [Lachnospiraceae bacterium]|nr:hypothetical protein [Lachnospiraceae bacterium]
MDFEERFAQAQAKLDELKAKINASLDSTKAAYQKEASDKLVEIDTAIEKFAEEIEAELGENFSYMKEQARKDAASIGESFDKLDERVQDKIDDDVDAVEGDISAAEENLRIVKDRADGKLNAARLKVQMHQEQIRDKIEAKKTSFDKAAQEALITDLLDYADDCQKIAYAYAMEAELAIMDACDEIKDYKEKYGE